MSSAILPAELIVLLFVFFLFFYGLASGRLASLGTFELVYGFRGRLIVDSLLIVSAFVSIQNYRRETAPVPDGQERVLAVTFGLALVPLMISIWLQMIRPGWEAFATFSPWNQFQAVAFAGIRSLSGGAPFVLVWIYFALMARRPHVRLKWTTVTVQAAASVVRFVREWLPLVIVIPLYFWIDEIRAPANTDFDPIIEAIDRALFFGHSPVIMLQTIVTRPLSEWLTFCYCFYAFAYPLSIGSCYLKGGQRGLREAVTGLTLGLCLAYIGYLLIPVKGPDLAMSFSVPIDLRLFDSVKETLMDSTRITYDCFPSFHTAGMIIMSWLCFRNARKIFPLFAMVTFFTPFACVYLRYHYVADVVAGAALGWIVIRITRAWMALSGVGSKLPAHASQPGESTSALSAEG